MSLYIINGANRGIGLELCRQLQQAGHEVIAVCREESVALQQLAVRIISGVDVYAGNMTDVLRDELADIAVIDVVIAVAGIWRTESIDDMNNATMLEQFQVNTLGSIDFIMALQQKLHHGSKIAVISSRMGSIADNSSGGRYGYRMSKAALNAAAKSLAIDVKDRGIAVAILHPGLVATDMTDHKGIAVNESCQQLIERIAACDLSHSGTFWHANGEVLPW